MNVMLFSNGKLPGNQKILEYGLEWIEETVKRTGAKKFVFVPYAMIRGDYNERVDALNEVLSPYGCEVVGIHQADDPVKAIEEADGILVSGGNTWVLNKTLHDLGLIRPIRQAVLNDNKLYIGWSAGTNIGTPTIRTTNDMPIVTAAILPALNLVPFQINPHYIEANISGHMGETRDERIEEFLVVNPHEVVVGIPEGTMLQVIGDTLTYHSANKAPLKLFRHQQESKYFNEGDDFSFLMNHGC
ncbi:dipeptidase PepE [Vibrio tapetis subsp. quintayensis]|uniref:dipeptidase PepE n=1 Tax=Vibrio tapetis TaxID=52443 RepID=UPI0025B53C74|nr:dipeptidase PepE [Vibrio tapetis]MDN3683101.1 dipeptidase PepE [Vibrio tapetis subsp. quintayensis]